MNKPVLPSSQAADADLEDLHRRMEALGPPPGLDDLSDEELDAQADDDIAAGRFISHGRMMAWLEALAADPKVSPPEPDVCDR